MRVSAGFLLLVATLLCLGTLHTALAWQCENCDLCLYIPPDTTVECSDVDDLTKCGTARATDNCDSNPTITYHDEKIYTSCAGQYTIKRTWTATDCCGNTVSKCQIIHVVDTCPPMLTIPSDKIVECDKNYTPEFCGTATAWDKCDPHPNITYVDVKTPGQCSGAYVIKRTWTATDCAGNKASATQTITVVDTCPPIITVPGDKIVECGDYDPNSCGSATAWDKCDPHPNITYVDVKLPGSCPGIYVIKRTWTATDCCGNKASGCQTITVVDTCPPIITAPADKTIECGSGIDLSSCGSATAWDKCDPHPSITYVDVKFPGSCNGTYVIKRTWTATDCSGNSASACQTITVIDTCPPVLTIPGDKTIECGSGIDLNFCGTATAWDKCDPHPKITYVDVKIPGSCNGTYVIKRTWTATDCSGNKISACQTITVVDTCPPVLTVPGDKTVECGKGYEVGSCGYATAWDKCDPHPVITYVDVKIPGSCNGYIIKRTWTAKDCAGNQASGCQTITVIDTCPPEVDVSPLCLWPPNHKWYCINSFCTSNLIRARDTCSSQVFIKFLGCTCRSSSQPENGLGDGNTSPDCEYDPSTDTLCLRAERAGIIKDDRIYSVYFTASDSWNENCCNKVTSILTVRVPHDQSNPADRNCVPANTNTN